MRIDDRGYMENMISCLRQELGVGVAKEGMIVSAAIKEIRRLRQENKRLTACNEKLEEAVSYLGR